MIDVSSLDDLTRERAEQLVGLPVEEWDGKCHGVSMALAPAVGGLVRRGYFLGEPAPDAYFAKGVAQHSWIELADGRVLDPTRHAITAQGRWPLWVGPSEDYDIGGCRTQRHGGSPPDFFETGHPPVELDRVSVDYLTGLLGTPHEMYGFASEDRGDGWVLASVEQCRWLANLPVLEREDAGALSTFFAAEVYDALVAAGQGAWIPVDRLAWICPEHVPGYQPQPDAQAVGR